MEKRATSKMCNFNYFFTYRFYPDGDVLLFVGGYKEKNEKQTGEKKANPCSIRGGRGWRRMCLKLDNKRKKGI